MIIRILALIMVCLLQPIQASENTPISIAYLGTNDFLIRKPVLSDSKYRLTVYNLDALANLEKALAKDLPANIVEAERIANARISELDEQETVKLFGGIALLVSWDIKKLPAFVFADGKYVIYGVTDAESAIRRYLNSRKRANYNE